MREEVGDLLFVITNIARHLQVEPEAALKLTNRKFRRRFEYIETKLRERKQDFEATPFGDGRVVAGSQIGRGSTAMSFETLTLF